MKDTSGAQVLGRTSLKRLGIVMVPTVVAAGALTVLMANGAVAVSLAISDEVWAETCLRRSVPGPVLVWKGIHRPM